MKRASQGVIVALICLVASLANVAASASAAGASIHSQLADSSQSFEAADSDNTASTDSQPSTRVRGRGPEIPALRTMYSRTFEGQNGTADLALYPEPVNYRRADGTWQPIDDDLRPLGAAYVDRGDRYRVQFPNFLSPGVSGAFAVGQGSYGVHFQLEHAGAAAVVTGATATYSDALPDTDVDLTATPTGLKDLLVLKGHDAPTSFTYDLQADGGLRPMLDPSGAVGLVDPTGAVQLIIPAPVASDAVGSRGPAKFSLSESDGDWKLEVHVDAKWLSSPARAFPVTVDPTTTKLAEPQVCTLVASSPNSSFCSEANVTTETQASGTDTQRGLIEFSAAALAQIPSDSEVIEATLTAKTTALKKQFTTATSATVYDVKTAWNTTATWNKPIAGGAEWAGGNPYDTAGSSAVAHIATNETLSASVKPLVQDWIGNKYGGFYGLGFSRASEAGEIPGAKLQVPRASPELVITYATITGQRRQYLYDHQELDDKMDLGVNVATGDLRLTSDDYTMNGPGISLAESRVYESRRMSTPVDLSLGWKFTLGRETRQSVVEGHTIWDAPDGSVTGLAGPATAANAMKGTGLGEGVDAVDVENAHLHGIMYDASGLTFAATKPGEPFSYFNRDGLTVGSTEEATSCPAHGPTVKIHDWAGAPALTLTTNCVGQGQVTKMEDPTGRVWKYGYDAQNRLHTYTDPEGGVTTYEYSAVNLLTKITTPAGNAALIEYDPGALGRVTKITRQDSHGTILAVTSYAYSEAGLAGPCQPHEFNTTETDPVGRMTQYCFDARHRLTHVIDPNGHERDAVTYGPFGQVQTVAPAVGGPGNPYANAIDATTGVVLGSTAPSGAETSNTYDPVNPYKPELTTDAQGNRVEMTYAGESADLLAVKPMTGPATSGPEQLSLTWEHGLLKSSALGKSPNQEITGYKYDGKGNQTEVTPPLPLKPTRSTYDALDRLSTTIDGDGNEATFHYDKLDRVKEITYSDGSAIGYTYDADGNLREESTPLGTAVYTYDGMERRTSASYGGETVTEDYYADGQLKDISDAGGTVTYTYNADGQLASVSDPATRELTDPVTKQPAVVQLHWDTDQPGGFPHGVLSEVDAPIGASHEKTGNLQTIYTYDANDRVKTIAATANGQSLQKWTYSYVNAANGNQQTGLRQFIQGPSGQQTTYSYDYMNRLTQAVTTDVTGKTQLYKYSYCYVSCGASHPTSQEGFSNILQKAVQVGTGTPTTSEYQYNGSNQLVGTGYTYDSAGNMTAAPGVQMGFNVRNQLAKLTLSGAEPLTLGQQGDSNSLLSTVGNTRLENSDLGVAATTNLEGGEGTYFTRTPEGQVIDSRKADGTGGHYYLTDDRESVSGTVSESLGTLDQAAPITYDPFGAPQGSPAPAIPTFGYDGGYQGIKSGSKTSNLIHLGERYYEPSTGSWTQRDPLGSANSYDYADDDPVNNGDPEGTCPFDKDLRPPVLTHGEFTYIEVCGTHGKKAGKRLGYLRINTGPQPIVTRGHHHFRCAKEVVLEASEYVATNCEGAPEEGTALPGYPDASPGDAVPGWDPVFLSEPEFAIA